MVSQPKDAWAKRGDKSIVDPQPSNTQSQLTKVHLTLISARKNRWWRICNITVLIGKVYRTIFQERERESIYLHIFIFVMKLKHDMNNFFMNLIDRLTGG